MKKSAFVHALVLALLGALGTTSVFAVTQVEDFSDGTLDGIWFSGNLGFGGEANSIVIGGGVLTFNKTASTAGTTEYVGMSGPSDNRIVAPWTVEYTIPDATDFGADAGYMIVRFWKPGAPVLDWVYIINSGGTINVGVAGGSVLYSFDAGTTASLNLKFDVAVSGLTVFAAANGGAYDAGQAVSWQSAVDASTVIGAYIAALDQYGPTVIGPFAISIDDLTITADTLPTGGGEGEGEGEGEPPLFPPGEFTFVESFDGDVFLSNCLWSINPLYSDASTCVVSNQQLHFVNTDAVNPVFTADYEAVIKPGFTLTYTISTADSTFGGNGYVWSRMFYGGGDLPGAALVSQYGGQYNLHTFWTGPLGTLPLSSQTVTVQHVVSTTSVDVYWGADGGPMTLMNSYPVVLDPAQDVTILLLGGTNWYAGAAAFDIAVDDVTLTSDLIPQCARNTTLPVAGLLGLGLAAGGLLCGGLLALRRRKDW